MIRRARTLVFVHGLWMTGHESIFLRRELKRRLDADARVFSYRSVADDVGESGRALGGFLRDIGSDEIHLVGHSLGGLVILKCLEDDQARTAGPKIAPGRVVLLGSPLQGTIAARTLSRFAVMKAVLGRSIAAEAHQALPRRWSGSRDVGVIAGDVSLGLGRLVASLPEPNDGTVAVQETHLAGAADHIVLPVSHSGLVLSAEVMRQTAAFLLSGRFSR